MSTAAPTANPVRRVLLAILIGATIEYFDFHIFATAAVLAATSMFLLCYLLTVFALSLGTSRLCCSHQEFLELQMAAVMLFAGGEYFPSRRE
jgi:NhaP-type Na+/H+ or K+/H+ antiporter